MLAGNLPLPNQNVSEISSSFLDNWSDLIICQDMRVVWTYYCKNILFTQALPITNLNFSFSNLSISDNNSKSFQNWRGKKWCLLFREAGNVHIGDIIPYFQMDQRLTRSDVCIFWMTYITKLTNYSSLKTLWKLRFSKTEIILMICLYYFMYLRVLA